MHKSKWLQWAGGLGMMSAIALGSTGLRADDESPTRQRSDKPAPREEGRPAAREEGRPAGDAPTEGRGRADAGRSRGMQQHYWLGLECRPAPGLVREQLNLPEGQGLVVEITAPDSPADKAGLKRHDILLTANDKPLGEVRQLIELAQASEGNAITFKVLRGGKEVSISVTPIKGGQPFGRGARASEQLEQLREQLERGGGDFGRLGEQIEQLRGQLERGGDPIRMRFFHPGMVLPPGAAMQPPLPEGMRVTITRNGSKPAEIEVQQGEETWKGTEEDLSKLPDRFRGPVAQMLGRGPANPRVNVEIPGERAERRRPEDGAMDQRMNELARQVEKLRQEIHELRGQRAGGRNDGPGGRERGPRDDEQSGRGRRGEGPSPPSRGAAPDSPPPAKESSADAPDKPRLQ
jgi:hypothetical protein